MKLFPFQAEMVNKFVNVKSVLCGDDMGLGKTVEAIALDMRRRVIAQQNGDKSHKKTLIIAPKSVLSSWVDHLQMMWPGVKFIMIDPKDRTKFSAALPEPYTYYVMHWDVLRLMPELRKVKWWHVIADECHRAKNRKAQMTQALKKLPTTFKTAMSGTPADDKPHDLWSILNWLYPRTWSSYWSFDRKHVVRQDVLVKGRTVSKIVGCAHVGELHRLMNPFYIRRLKEVVAKDLPEKYYTTIKVDLDPKQRRAYEDMRREMVAWVGEHEDEPLAAPMVIAQLTRLKQLALAHADFEIVMKNGQPHRRVKLVDPSTKLDALMELIDDNPGKPIVVASESKQIINLLGKRLAAKGVRFGLLTGDTKTEDRGRLVREFQAGHLDVFAFTIAAGGVGITLTRASTIVFLDRCWNPSLNRQAEDRLHRIGQRNAVQVIDIIARDTIDAGRLQQIQLKWEWIKQILGDKASEERVLV